MNEYEVGDKFIVEIDKVLADKGLPWDDNELFRIKGFKSLVFDEFGLDKLEKYEQEPISKDEVDSIIKHDCSNYYEAGMREAWDIARKIKYDLTSSELIKIFGTDNESAIFSYTPQEAKAKIEAWEKAKEEIKVGDEVTDRHRNTNYVVTGIKSDDGTVWYCVMNEKGLCTNVKISALIKTGRHIDIQSILEQIGGKNEQ